LGLLFPLAAIAVLIEAVLSSLSAVPLSWSVGSGRLLVVGLNLVILGGACSFAVNTHSLRFDRPDGGPFPVESWQSQVRAIARLAALPLGALVVVLVLPVSVHTNFLAAGITLLAAFVLLVAHASVAAGGANRIPT
jgi:hypothetical protein